MKDHEIALLVNQIRDIAVECRDAQQLRCRIANALVPVLKEPIAPAAADDAADGELIADLIEQNRTLRARLDSAQKPAVEAGALGITTEFKDWFEREWSSYQDKAISGGKIVSMAWALKGYRTAPPTASAQKGLNDAARDVIAERQRQVEKEGWTPEHDDGANDVAAMADAAACYAMHAGQVLAQAYCTRCLKPHRLWPWDARWWKPTTPRRDLVKAGALILAEIERIDRALLRESEGK